MNSGSGQYIADMMKMKMNQMMQKHKWSRDTEPGVDVQSEDRVGFQTLVVFYRQMSEQSLLEKHAGIPTGFRFHSALNDPNQPPEASWHVLDSIQCYRNSNAQLYTDSIHTLHKCCFLNMLMSLTGSNHEPSSIH